MTVLTFGLDGNRLFLCYGSCQSSEKQSPDGMESVLGKWRVQETDSKKMVPKWVEPLQDRKMHTVPSMSVMCMDCRLSKKVRVKTGLEKIVLWIQENLETERI